MNKGLAVSITFIIAFFGGFLVRGLLFHEYETPKAVIVEVSADRLPPSYAEAFDNAVAFRNEARSEALGVKPDSLTINFLKGYVKPLRNAGGQSESLSIPRAALRGNYYLIVNDSIYLMSPVPVRFKFK